MPPSDTRVDPRVAARGEARSEARAALRAPAAGPVPRQIPGARADGDDAQMRALTLLTNRTSTRTSATGGPALPLRDGVRVYLEGLEDTAAAAEYAQPVADPAEAEVAVLRIDCPAPDGITDDDTDRVLDIAAAVPTIVVLRIEGTSPAPEFTGNCAALLADRGASDRMVLDVVFGRHAPLGRLAFPIGPAQDPDFPAGFGLSY
ncbi:glycoside hydrolase family 3 C-terminal domain-containing protein [Yinghuangia soli]|uniref:Glycoside hydrolase family 3 C-terminal domain-containing protein n=1 Tax=Yinghuangia soli TaxID=2908204 RepID=A0AA41TZT4_9ACTN|nr:glycoside hydrolase family 3 C-terminal domain-containing protein [Yinghuangia soli]MCF2527640.1 glycoside hydrolase family 3 C-terminal domain-containing protein [Yinghuangia soli]